MALAQGLLFCFPGKRNTAAECLITVGVSVAMVIFEILSLGLAYGDREMLALASVLVQAAITIVVFGPLKLTDWLWAKNKRYGHDVDEHAGTVVEDTSQHSIVPLGVGSDPQPEI